MAGPLVMILDPINSITSVVFYRKVARQTTGRSLLYLCYLAFLFSIVSLFAVRSRVMPVVADVFDWLAKNVPPITISAGKVTTPLTAPLTLRHPLAPEAGVTIDTQRQEAVTPKMLEDNKAVAYLSGNAFYLMRRPGQLDVYDLSKSDNPSAKPVVIDAEFYKSSARLAAKVIYPAAAVVAFAIFLVWKLSASLLYSTVALMVNGALEAGLEYGPLFNISVHAQTLVIVVQGMLLFVPGTVPGLSILTWIAVSIYLWLAVRINAPSAQSPAA